MNHYIFEGGGGWANVLVSVYAVHGPLYFFGGEGDGQMFFSLFMLCMKFLGNCRNTPPSLQKYDGLSHKTNACLSISPV